MKSLILAFKLLLTALIVNACIPEIASDANRAKPNIIFILADDFGRELLSAYGGKSYETPVLDKMSKQGLTFKNTYATPMCAPSRMMFLTGQYNFRNYSEWDEMNFGLKTVASYMRDAGYITGMAGKWHRGGWDLNPKGPEKAGFMHYSSYDYKKFHPNAFWNIDIWQNNELIKLGKHDSSSEIFNDYTINFIKQNKDHPFFFYYAMNLVHRPFLPTPVNENIDSTNFERIITKNQGSADYFAENVNYLDKLVGRIIETLKEEQLLENTILIFSGDNGTDNVAEAKDLFSEFKDSFSTESVSRKIRGDKYYPTELGVNVPLLIYAPGFIQESNTITHPVDFTDMLPSFYELGGGSINDLFTDGHSFASLIVGGEYKPRDWIYSYGNFENNSSKYKNPINNSDDFYHVISDGSWKFYSDGRLFQVNNDVLEVNEIPEGYSEESDLARKRLRYQLHTLRNSTPRIW